MITPVPRNATGATKSPMASHKMRLITIAVIVFALLLSYVITTSTVLAAYIGPTEVMNTTFGERPDQFEIVKEDTDELFPEDFYVLDNGTVAIADGLDVKLFDSSGFINLFNVSQGVGFTAEVHFFHEGLYVVGAVPGADGVIKNDIYLYDYQGNFKKMIKYGGYIGGVDDVLSTGELITRKQDAYYKYSSTGQLIKSYSSKPLELGLKKEGVPLSSGYRHIIQYQDQIYSFVIPNLSLTSYVRDLQENLYATAKINKNDSVYRINRCGKIVSSLKMPAAIEGPSRKIGIEEYSTYLEEYGKPSITEDGNVYTWKKTPIKYSILKWTWVADPNVPTGPEPPTNLSLTPSINGLYLTWKASPNDPGCVTKYEIARSTTSGGVFSTIDTVEKGVLKYNDTTAETGTKYYYKVRALVGSDPSAYTSEVSGKR